MRNKNKLVHGWGINDVDYPVQRYESINGKNKLVWVCPYYQDWKKIICRCFDSNEHIRYPTYSLCTVDPEWKYLSNFIKWVDSQPNRDWVNCQPDKDLLIFNNKHYSPETCVYISGKLNVFVTDSGKARGTLMLGVSFSNSKVNPFRARCGNPFNPKRNLLGSYPTELEAHKAWQAKKHEHALRLAEGQDDHRVAKALRERYAPDKDWTNV